jgi:DNA polymerase-3 subunit alpha
MGLITNLRITKRKSDGKPMAFFDLEDGTGVISVCCFTKAYEKNKEMIEEGKVVKIKGSIKEKNDDFMSEDIEEISFELWVDTIYNLEKSLPDLLISIDSIESWVKYVYPYIDKQGYKTQNGYKLFIMDNLFNELRVANFEVSQGILKDKILNPTIKKK